MSDIIPFIVLAFSIGVLIYAYGTHRRIDRYERSLRQEERIHSNDDAAPGRHRAAN